MTGILQQIMGTMEQTRTMSALDSVSMIGFAALLVLGIINCVLGYRLLRFWMMLFGFLTEAVLVLAWPILWEFRKNICMR